MARPRFGSKRWLAGLIVAVAVAVLAGRGAPQPASPRSRAPLPFRLTAQAVKVYDGDSIVVEWKGKTHTIRLFGIDCPEHGQGGSDEAQKFTREFVLGQRLEIETRDWDSKYDRDVSIVRLKGRELNAELVRAGWAWAYRRYSDQYVSAEAEARGAKRGLWAQPDQEPPWEYRKTHPRGVRR